MDTKTEQKESFQAPRHWVSIEELNPDYWTDKAAQTRRGQEFAHKPIETLEAIEKMDQGGVSRREFLTVMGASMAMASMACAKRPVSKIIPYVVQPQEVTPGNPVYYASTCKECAKGCGILVKTREGRPIKLEGNDAHSMNQGALCATGQASVLNLYDPDRIKMPMKGSKNGSKSAASWSEIDSLVADALKEAKKVRVLTSPQTGESTRRLMKEFLTAFSDGKWIEVDPIGQEDVADAQVESYGARVVPHYAFDQADVVVSFGADFLGTWGNSVSQAKDWSKKRKLDTAKDSLSKVYVFESNMSITGAGADERFPIVPGSEVAVAMAVAHELIVVQKKTKFAGQIDVVAALNAATAESLLGKAGSLSADSIHTIAADLWNARGKSIVVGSGSMALQTVVNLLNSALENEGKTVDGTAMHQSYTASSRQLALLQSEMESGQIDVLIVNRSNPVYFLPMGDAFAKAMSKVKTVISVSDRIDETAQVADIVAAENHDLENWGDAHATAHIYSLQQPSISPLHDTRSFEDAMIGFVRASKKGSGLLATIASSPKGSFYDFVKENWKQSVFPANGKGQTFGAFWEDCLQKGVLEVKGAVSRERPFRAASLKSAQTAVTELKMVSIAQSKKGSMIEGSGVVLGLYEKVSMGDGSRANNAWLQEMPDPISTVTWDNYANIGPAFANDLGLKNWDVISIKGENASIELPVNVQPGIARGVVTIALGYGRTSVGQVGSGVGANAFKLASFNSTNGIMLSGQTVTIARTGKRYELAAVQGHHLTEGRPVLNDISLAQFQKDPASAMHTNPHLKLKEVPSMWTPPVDYAKSPYRWMMGVDLNSCTGCGACVIACMAENNTPVVGRDRIRMGREMHWIRIDRYYSGSEHAPKMIFQPMMCQHCENAPCETVCPVVATSHNEEGLNQMTYSRCVGTRYCQNNCPYKVRRFNFFDHWKDYKDTANMVWNPDVTVRSRGIMEKCTFCVQRINESKGHAKDQSTKVKDRDLMTACQQTCPTEAIVFGNVNDPESAINRVKDHARAFRVLEILNTKPSVHYLTKVRNIPAEEAAHGHK